MTTTILLIALIVALLGGILLLLPRLARPTLPFGVRVPDSHADAPAVREATSAYYRGVIVTMLVVAVALIAVTPIASSGVVLTAAGLLPIAAWLLPYLSARRTVLAAKRSEGWYDGIQQTVAADTSWRTSPLAYPWRWAVPAIVIALVTVVAGVVVYPSLPNRIATRFNLGGDPVQFTTTTVWSAFGLVGIQLLLTALLLGLALLALRSKADIAATDPHASADQYRRYAVTMAKAILALAAGMNLTLLIVALMSWDVVPANVGWQVASLLPSLVTAVGLIVVSIRTGQSGHRLASASSDEHADPATSHRDDDAHWIGGLIYVNRDDPSLFVPKRFGGVGWTINMARPAAWALAAALLAIAIGVPIWAVAQASDDTSSDPEPAAEAQKEPETDAAPVAVDLTAIEGTPIEDRLTWVLTALAGDQPPAESEIEAAFDDVALAETSAADLRSVLGQLAGAYRMTALHNATRTSLTGEIDDGAGQHWQLLLESTDDEEPRITSLFFQQPLADARTFSSWDEADDALRTLAGNVTYLAAEVDGTTCQPLASYDPDVRQPLGSTFKLYVLGALADAVADGTVAWDDDLVIDEHLQSLPSGQLQDAEPGTTVPVAEAARLMMSISDNTATDHLIALLGRETVEQAQASYGHQDPAVNQPFLATRELYQLKWQLDEDARATYLAEDETGRRAVLNELAGGPLDVIPADITTPVEPDTLEWFASADELCAALAGLDESATLPGLEPVAEALGANPIVRLDGRWERFAAKGGSEPGVLTFAWLLERADGRTFAFAVTMLDDGVIDQNAAIPVVEGALNLLADANG